MTEALSAWQSWVDRHPQLEKANLFFFAEMMLQADVKLHSKMSYGAPFIYRLGPVGYFSIDKKRGLYFGFYWGKLLLEFDEYRILDADERKMVKLVYLSGKMNDEAFIGSFLSLLDAALKLDQEKYGK